MLTLTLAEDEQGGPAEHAVVREFKNTEQAVVYTEVVSQVKDLFEPEEKNDDRQRSN